MTAFVLTLLVLVAAITAYTYADVKRQQPSLPPELENLEEGETFETEGVMLDGDTVRVPAFDADLRLARIDAPEKGTPGAERAQDALAEKLDTADAVDMELVEVGKWGRPVVELYADGESVSDWMLENGYADRY